MVTARNRAELDNALASAVRQRVNGLLVVRDALFFQYRKRVVEFATKNRLPTIFGITDAAVDGGLMSYAANFQELIRRTTGYVDRIFKGANPGELPIDQAAAFELAINLRTANQLGMIILSRCC